MTDISDLQAIDQILVLYNTQKDLDPDHIEKRMEELRSASGAHPNFSLLCEMELLRLHSCKDFTLTQEILELRLQIAKLRNLPHPSNSSMQSDRSQLLQEACFLTIQALKHRELYKRFARLKFRLLVVIGCCVLPAFPIVALVIAFGNRDPVVLAVMLSGLIGAFVSCYLRIYPATPGDDPEAAYDALKAEFSGLVAKPLIGATFALILYLLFISSMVTGTLFPSLILGDGGSKVGFGGFFSAGVHASQSDFAKLIVWCFTAGFAERLVPDILERFRKQGSETTPTRSSK